MTAMFSVRPAQRVDTARRFGCLVRFGSVTSKHMPRSVHGEMNSRSMPTGARNAAAFHQHQVIDDNSAQARRAKH